MSPLSNTSEFSLRGLEAIASASGLSAGRDIAWSSRVSVGSFQRSFRGDFVYLRGDSEKR